MNLINLTAYKKIKLINKKRICWLNLSDKNLQFFSMPEQNVKTSMQTVFDV